jgi:hypothetical protein
VPWRRHEIARPAKKPVAARHPRYQMESKAKMRARGVKSPDFADALMLAFAAGEKRHFAFAWA